MFLQLNIKLMQKESNNKILEDLALEFKVSKRTIIRALKGASKNIYGAPAQRSQKIREEAAKRHYHPNPAARAFATGQHNVVGLLNPGGSNNSYISSSALRGITDALTLQSWTLGVMGSRVDLSLLTEEPFQGIFI